MENDLKNTTWFLGINSRESLVKDWNLFGLMDKSVVKSQCKRLSHSRHCEIVYLNENKGVGQNQGT